MRKMGVRSFFSKLRDAVQVYCSGHVPHQRTSLQQYKYSIGDIPEEIYYGEDGV